MTQLIQSLPSGPLDIIGDVHGEATALVRLLNKLGCDPNHGTAQRPIVFVGDLVDRGPNSPAVVEIVMRLVENGVGHCVMGNHEYNLLLGHAKEGNGWFRDDPQDHFQIKKKDQVLNKTFDSISATPEQAERYQEFFATLPLAMERSDLRVVHACWHTESIARLPQTGDIKSLSQAWSKAIFDDQVARGVWAAEKAERNRFADLKRLDIKPTEDLPHHAEGSQERQGRHPIKVLTSGREKRIPFENIFFVGGKWRFVRRLDWWMEYEDDQAVVVGHYWRQRTAIEKAQDSIPWQTSHPLDWTGPKRNVFCLDYSVGRRFLERALGENENFAHGLAALRWPERTIVFDDRPGVEQTGNYRAISQ